MNTLAIIYNPSAGNQNDTNSLKAAFSAYKGTLLFYPIEQGLDALITRVNDDAPTLLVAAGGDGTVNFVAQLAIKTKLPMGVLPVGTLNHFAKDMGIPLDIDAAVQVIQSRKLHAIDYCSINDQVFLNNSSIGIYPLAVRKREKLQHTIGKRISTVVATLFAAFKFSATHLEFEINSKQHAYKTPLFFVGNNSYGFDKVGIANREAIDSGKLFIYVVRANRLMGLLRLLVFTFFGKHRADRVFSITTQHSVTVYSRKPVINVSVDGEVKALKPPLRYAIHPGSLRVCVPIT